MDPQRITDQSYRVVIEDRIAELWAYRAWWRTHVWAEHPLRRQETDTELRSLVKLARKARRISRPVIAAADYPADMTFVDLSLGDHHVGIGR